MKMLDEIPKNNPFKVPENYFEEVNRKIISATSGHIPEVKRTNRFKRFRPYLLAAASVAGFIILTYTAVTLLTTQKTNSQLSEILFDDYSDVNINDIDIFALEQSAQSIVFTEEMPDFSNTEIIDYLILENIDINDIYEQL